MDAELSEFAGRRETDSAGSTRDKRCPSLLCQVHSRSSSKETGAIHSSLSLPSFRNIFICGNKLKVAAYQHRKRSQFQNGD